MAFAPASPITGAAITGLTSPTYTHVSDTAPNINGKQFAVTQTGGTQTGVDVNSVSKPFTFTMFRPPQLRTLPPANPVTGVVKNIPVNVYKLVTRKGALPSANQQTQVMNVTTIITVPAGCDTYEPEEIRAMLSLHFGVSWAQADGIASTVITGVL